MMKKMIVLGVLSCSLLLSACASSGSPQAVTLQQTGERNVVTTTASEEIKVIPDIAEVVYGIYTEAADAASCQAQNSADIAKVVELLKGLGIDEKSIQTSGYELSPRYSWADDKQTLIGYSMRTQLTVSDLLLDKVGTVLAESVNAGINTVESITYQSSTYDESYQEALKAAVTSAKAKAGAMAEAGGCDVGVVVTMEEYQNESAARNTTYLQKEAAVMDTGAGSARVMPGEVSVEARVSVTFEVLNK